ncbi:NADPH:quinone reductase-like Zn-dependent oxidoreductase [Dyadobacter jejuensis]|uniref:NADPH:quinone reductase-like Zn-dependent oxidoreductase n=1 Tax=Dyadobacter jejuensis TaxID=1082580 RepID=A0A316AKS3_9BACT|nr:NADP-dependent oxidoreductase [Dyadobacter jejuensis]PWJ57839.1 NADPH:quinone reductase-like Zn-dependent oxidoreductase [Dyadobacter jejuensis]
MKAIQIKQYGDNSVLEQVDIAIPKAQPHQVVVQIKASSVNPVDYKIRSGFLAGQLTKTFPFTLGWEGAGIVTEVGEAVTLYKPGDEVMLMPNFMQGGTYAAYVAVNENEVTPKPKSISFTDASIIPFSLGTAYTALVEDAAIKNGQKILIHGAGGAVGQMAVQIAKNSGLSVIGTATGENLQELLALGIDQVIDYTKADFSSVLHDLDVVLDLVGGETLAKSYSIVKKGGVIVSTTQPPNPSALEKYGLTGKMTLTRMEPNKFSEVIGWLEQGKIKVKKPWIYDLSRAQEALSMVESRKAKSKIVFEF